MFPVTFSRMTQYEFQTQVKFSKACKRGFVFIPMSSSAMLGYSDYLGALKTSYSD